MNNGLIIPGQSRTQASTQSTDVDPTEVRRLAEQMLADHREKKRVAVLALESVITLIKEQDRPERMQAVITTIKSHPLDFQLLELKNTEVHMIMVSQAFEHDSQQRPVSDLVLYWTLDRQVAFGAWNGRYVQKGQPSVTTTMRPQRFVEIMIPDGSYAEPEIDAAFDGMRAIVAHLAGLTDMGNNA